MIYSERDLINRPYYAANSWQTKAGCAADDREQYVLWIHISFVYPIADQEHHRLKEPRRLVGLRERQKNLWNMPPPGFIINAPGGDCGFISASR